MLKGGTIGENGICKKNGVNKVLNTPVHLGTMAATLESQVEQIKSIWVSTRDDGMVIISALLFTLYRYIY